MERQSGKQRSCLYGIGWIRQKSDWLKELRRFTGYAWIDLGMMDARMRKQLEDGSAYYDDSGARATPGKASIIRLDTGVVSNSNVCGESRFVEIIFKRNRYAMWEGIDIELGAEAPAEMIDKMSRHLEHEDPLLGDIEFKKDGGRYVWMQDLASVAVEESWDNGDDAFGAILPYIRYTYARLKEDGKVVVSQDGDAMCFNTGLVARSTLDPIVIICKKNPEAGARCWCFERIFIWSDEERKDALLIKKFGGRVPPSVNWFEKVKKRGLLRSDIDMSEDSMNLIFASLRRSIPDSILMRIAKDEKRPDVENQIDGLIRMRRDKVDKKMLISAYNKIKAGLGTEEEVTALAEDIFKKSFDVALKRLAWEPDTAVPFYAAYKPGMNFSYLLPLSFEDGKPFDVELTVILEPMQNAAMEEVYRPKAFLDLRAAYSNARLLRSPKVFWLGNPNGLK